MTIQFEFRISLLAIISPIRQVLRIFLRRSFYILTKEGSLSIMRILVLFLTRAMTIGFADVRRNLNNLEEKGQITAIKAGRLWSLVSGFNFLSTVESMNIEISHTKVLTILWIL